MLLRTRRTDQLCCKKSCLFNGQSFCREQCDSMTRLFVQNLAIFKNWKFAQIAKYFTNLASNLLTNTK